MLSLISSAFITAHSFLGPLAHPQVPWEWLAGGEGPSLLRPPPEHGVQEAATFNPDTDITSQAPRFAKANSAILMVVEGWHAHSWSHEQA